MPGRKRYNALVLAVDDVNKKKDQFLPPWELGNDLVTKARAYTDNEYNALIAEINSINGLAVNLQNHPHLYKLTKRAADRVVKDVTNLLNVTNDAKEKRDELYKFGHEPTDSQLEFSSNTWNTHVMRAFDSLYDDVHSTDFNRRQLDASFVPLGS